MKYGRKYDFNKTFFEQWMHLQRSIPHLSLIQKKSIASPWINYETNDKDCYLNFGGKGNVRCSYNQYAINCEDCIDNFWIKESKFCYENIFCENCKQVFYSTYCFDCTGAYFSFDCKNCSNIFGCSGLRNQDYVIFNKKVTQEYFNKFMLENPLSENSNFINMKALSERSLEMTKRRALFHENSENVRGHLIQDSLNCKDCFMVEYSENLIYGMLSESVKNSADVTAVWDGDMLYEVIGGSGGIKNISFSYGISNNSSNVVYSSMLSNCNYCFGCINLSNKSYCILNRQYSKREYYDLVLRFSPQVQDNVPPIVARIPMQMHEMPFIDRCGRTYRYGEFFPISISPFAYNESMAYDYFPLEKSVILSEYLLYADIDKEIKREFESSGSNGDQIWHVLNSEISGNQFSVTQSELDFYKNFKLPMPSISPFERQRKRLDYISNHRNLYSRRCSGCGDEIESVYLKNEIEHIFCEKCYKNK